ncbi:MAG: hypothetical protein DWI48_00645 [Chloroflexi bacterium]|nr:MAG: hypothetical protein DWI48_00645 [Chloroflexota bacterium]
MPVDPVSSPSSAYPQATPTPPPSRRDFAAVLATQLDEPRSDIAQVRAEIAAIRSGRPPASSAPSRTTSSSGETLAQKLQNWSAHGTGPDDQYGWRVLTRAYGEDVAPGFGTLFERQINQESGFNPEVVLGQRKSSAGAEGIAQLMPQFYPGVDRTDPQASLAAAADSMRHYLQAFDGDARKALASYNAGMGRVQQLVAAHGANWEQALPLETKQYLGAILGDTNGRIVARTGSSAGAGVFGGRGAGGVLTSPLDRVIAKLRDGDGLALRALAGADVRAPADGVVTSIGASPLGSLLTLDNGNGWSTTLDGLGRLTPKLGDHVSRGSVLGTLAGGDGMETAMRLGVLLNGRAVDPRSFLLGS